MGMFDKIKGRLGKKKDTTTSSTEDSFDLDDDALFESGGAAPGAGASLGDLDAFDSGGGGLEDFGTLEEDEGDVGAAATADFDDLSDLAGSLEAAPLDDFGGDLDADFGEPEPATGKKKGKKVRAGGRRGKGKPILVSLVAAVIGLGAGFFAVEPVMDIVTGRAKLQADLEQAQAELTTANAKLLPLQRAGTLEQIQQMQQELARRQELAQALTDIETKVADRSEQEAARDEAVLAQSVAEESLAVRQAELRNIAKQVLQIDQRIAYLESESVRFAQVTADHDAQVRKLQHELPERYVQQATDDAARVLSVQASVEAAIVP